MLPCATRAVVGGVRRCGVRRFGGRERCRGVCRVATGGVSRWARGAIVLRARMCGVRCRKGGARGVRRCGVRRVGAAVVSHHVCGGGRRRGGCRVEAVGAAVVCAARPEAVCAAAVGAAMGAGSAAVGAAQPKAGVRRGCAVRCARVRCAVLRVWGAREVRCCGVRRCGVRRFGGRERCRVVFAARVGKAVGAAAVGAA